MFKTYEINVDLISDTAVPSSAIRFSTNDRNAAELLLTITNKGAEIDLSQAKSVRISFKKPDGTRVFQNDCQPINALKGKYRIVLKTQTLAAEGYVYAQIHIEEEDRTIDTQKFFFVVNESLAGDGAVESTNEFTIIQKALELGEKFKNVDFDPIIKAGELSAGALPKTGGTMTGTLTSGSVYPMDFKGAKGQPNWTLRHLSSDGSLVFAPSKTPEGTDWDWTKQIVFHPVKGFQVSGDTNLVKKSGDIVTGNLGLQQSSAGATRKFSFFNELGEEIFNFFTQGNNLAMRDVKGLQDIWTYSSATKTFSLVTPNSNLVKSSGDTMTGALTMDIDKDLVFKAKDSQFKLRGQLANNRLVLQSINAAGVDRFVLHYDADTDTFNLNAANTNLVTKTKDARATITVTADAELTGVNGVIADRRGNTVTLRAPFRRKAGSTGSTVFTMPPGMRPTLSLYQNVVANDGTVGLLTIVPDGIVTLTSVGSTNIAGKDLSVVLTYVVD